MTAPTRYVAVLVLTGAWATGFVFAQAPTPPPAPAQAPPAGQAPAAGRGQVAAPAGAGRQGGFTQYTRPIASQDVLIRGQGLYNNLCASCHQADMRGTVDGKHPNLLRSGIALRDQHGELIGAAVKTHRPALTLVDADNVAIAEYIHSVHATMGGQGSPPGRNPTNVTLNVLVGDAQAGQATFQARCGACHSVTGDLRGIASKFADARALQNGWVSGATGTFGGGGRGGGGNVPGVVTLANGTRLEGTIQRYDDFMVTIVLPDGTRRTLGRTDGVPRVEERDPKRPHIDAIVKLAHEDSTSKMMHDITAYLWTIK
jgi:cytochrome c oxidase cbb3-type subunit III